MIDGLVTSFITAKTTAAIVLDFDWKTKLREKEVYIIGIFHDEFEISEGIRT